MHARGGVFCPECGSQLADEGALVAERATIPAQAG